MAFVFMVFHYPEPDRRDELAEEMRGMAAHMSSLPGFVGVDPPLWDETADAVVGISRWQSREAFLSVFEVGDATVAAGERAPRQRFLLDEC